MTRLLVSVRNPAEALVALESGAHLIDVKEPARGALGMADPAQIRDIVRAVAGRAPTSAALGELLAGSPLEELPPGLTFAKFGLAGAAAELRWPALLAAAIERLPPAVTPIAVAYADWERAEAPDPNAVLRVAKQLGCGGVLLDTFDKSRGSLAQLWPRARVAEFRLAAAGAELVCVLAGGLAIEDLPRIVALGPDYVGVRGAACRGGRAGALDAALVRQLVEAVQSEEPRAVSAGALRAPC